MVVRRVGGEPLEYVLGWVEFAGLQIIVEPGVFVPRRRTEVLVNEADDSRGRERSWSICAAVSGQLVLRCSRPARASSFTQRTSTCRVACARLDLEPEGHVHEGDLFAALPTDAEGPRRHRRGQRAVRTH